MFPQRNAGGINTTIGLEIIMWVYLPVHTINIIIVGCTYKYSVMGTILEYSKRFCVDYGYTGR